MSQDLRRDRKIGGNVRISDGILLYDGVTPIGTMFTAEWAAQVVEALKNAQYWRQMSEGQTERNAELVQQLHVANAAIAEANDALEQARRDAGLQRLHDWIAAKEATIAERAKEACDAAPTGFRDLGAIESRAAKLRRAQYDSKLLAELCGLLAGLDAEKAQPAVRYWAVGNEVLRVEGNREAEYWSPGRGGWRRAYTNGSIADLVADNRRAREISAAELPDGVTP